MANTSLTYGLFARDNASPVFARLSRSISTTNRSMSGFSSGFSRMGGAIAFAAKGAAIGLGAMAAAGAVAGIKTAASLQQAQISFETLLGSAKKASAFLTSATAFAAKTPFQTQDVIAYSRALLGAGQAAKDILPTLTAWGDTSGALGQSQEQFSRTMIAVTQIMNKGKVQAEELMQISESGIPIWGELSKALGMPIPAIQELMKQGQLLSKDVLPALQAQLEKDYGGAMGRQAQTLTGLWSTFKDTLSLGLAKAIQPLIPMLTAAMPKAIDAMSGALNRVSGFLAQAIPAVQGFFQSLGDSSQVQGVAGWVQNSLVPAFQNLANDVFPQIKKAWGDFTNTIGENKGVFMALGTIVTDIWLPALGMVAKVIFKSLGPAFHFIMYALKTVVIPAFVNWAKVVLKTLDIIISGAAHAFGWVPGIGKKLKAANRSFDQFAGGVNAALDSIVTNLDVSVNVHVRTVNEDIAGGIDGRELTPQQAAAQNRTRIAHAAAAGAANKAKAAGKAVTSSLAEGIASAAPKVSTAGDKVKDAATKKFDEIKQAAESLRSSVHDSVMGFFTLQSEGNPFANLGQMAKKAVAFANALGRLAKQGVNPAVISMIAQAGPDVGLRAAQMLSTAGKANRSRINNAYSTIEGAANRAAGYVVGAQTPDSLGVAKRSEGHLANIERAVTRHHRANPLANGWAAA